MKVIVAGSRTFNDYELLKNTLDFLLGNRKDIEIVSGMANGADKLGERYAKENGCDIKQFPADWNKYGKKAGYIRNKEMANYATHCVCFWDGKSAGTELMTRLAKENNLSLKIITY